MNHISQEILKAEEQLMASMMTSNLTALEHLLADDLQFVTQNGVVMTKEMDLENHRSGQLKIHTLNPTERVIKFFDSAAIVTTKVSLKGTFNSNAFTGTFRYLRAWAKHDGRWQVIGGSVSEAQE